MIEENAFACTYIGDVPLLETVPLYFCDFPEYHVPPASLHQHPTEHELLAKALITDSVLESAA